MGTGRGNFPEARGTKPPPGVVRRGVEGVCGLEEESVVAKEEAEEEEEEVVWEEEGREEVEGVVVRVLIAMREFEVEGREVERPREREGSKGGC